MNYAYLYINRYKGEERTDFFDQLVKSISVLRENTTDANVFVYHDPDDVEIVRYCSENSITAKPVHHHRPFHGIIRILVEKIFILMDFPADQDVVLLDVDTTFKQHISNNLWGNNPILWHAEYYITQFRNLENILPYLPWYEVDINFNTSYVMYNTGVVYIPKEHRNEICRNALWIVDRLNDGKNPEFRYGNKLDEQIGLSIATHHKYLDKGGVFTCKDLINHFWEEKVTGQKWWK